MRPLFTLHAGEVLVGSEIERRLPEMLIWVPGRDTGIDLLVTDSSRKRAVGLQVKLSRDYGIRQQDAALRACWFGWWRHDLTKIRQSQAELWVLVLHGLAAKVTRYVLIPPHELATRLAAIHPKDSHSYLLTTPQGKCWEVRGLTKSEQAQIAGGGSADPSRDFTAHLDAWHTLEQLLSAS